jgi:glycosyltransferase involved in cell wall biosynthesis
VEAKAPERLRISAFFPAYNDAGTIASIVIAAVRTLERVAAEYEVIVVDDGSHDATPEILEELCRLYPGKVRTLRHTANRGYGGALRSGLAAARLDWIFYTDGDGQYDAHELELLAGRAGENVDVVNGYKISRSDPLYRKLIGWLYNRVVKIAFRLSIRDIDCDFRLMRRSLFGRFELRSSSGTICVEMIKNFQDHGFRFAEVPVHHYHRAYGQSQFFNFQRLFKTGIDLILLWHELVIKRSHLKCKQVKVASGPVES